jgi:isonocardicin synthase
MPHGLHPSEVIHYQNTFFKDVKPVETIDITAIMNRDTTCVYERHHYYPKDYFFFKHNGVNYFGRKTLSTLYLEGKQPYKKCNQIKATMILGLLLRHQTTEKGLVFYYKPLQNDEKVFLFMQMKANLKTDIYFPFPSFDKKLQEYVQSVDAWDPTGGELADDLNVGEAHIRDYTHELLSTYNLTGKKIYDPACSTGEFLGSIKKRFPETYTIGQDINPDMIKHAKAHSPIDELHAGTALYPAVGPNSVDFIFLRFLNTSVVSTAVALQLFTKIANCCKDDGIIIVFGFTPVLLSGEIFEMLNLKVKQNIAYSKQHDSVFQYYVLQKNGPVATLKYENYSLFKLDKKQFLTQIVPNIMAAGQEKKADERRITCKL